PFSSSLSGEGAPMAVKMAGLTPGFFSLLGIKPGLGREFSEKDLPSAASSGSVPTVQATPLILSHGLWVSRFGSDPAILGRKVQVNGAPMTVVGVMPADTRFFQMLKAAGLGINDELQAWLPLNTRNPNWPRHLRTIRVLGRLKQGLTVAQAQQQVDSLSKRMREQHLELSQSGFRFELAPLRSDLLTHVEPALLALLGAVGFVLLIACANVANLLMARAASRRSEISIRSALGAGRSAIIRQMLSESFLLALGGALAGLILASFGVEWLIRLQPSNLPRLDEVQLDASVLAFTLAASLASAFLFGLLPAFQASQPGLTASLNQVGKAGSTSGHNRAVNLLIVAQVALSLVLLIGAGLMLRSFAYLQEAQLGFEPQNALSAHISLPFNRYPTSTQRADFFQRLQNELESEAGVEAAGAGMMLPLDGGWWTGPYWLAGEQASARESQRSADYRIITPGYFAAMGTRLIEGRSFHEEEYRDPRPVAVIDEVLARQAWPESWPAESALGKVIRILPEQIPAHPAPIELRVVGVAEHVRHDHPGRDSRPTVYFPPSYCAFTSFMDMVVRGRPGTDLAAAVQKGVHKLDKDLPVSEIRPLGAYVDESLAPLRFSLFLTGIFAAVAMLLALVGLYGVLSYSVTRRTRELGLRMALGAQRRQILGNVLGESLRLTLLGALFGLMGAAALTRLITTSLHGVSPLDPVTFGSVVLLLVSISLAACYLPARRAMRVDPLEALRAE
ncbi:MAG: ABC transporter permease, partial [Acidobacteriota bacterium]